MEQRAHGSPHVGDRFGVGAAPPTPLGCRAAFLPHPALTASPTDESGAVAEVRAREFPDADDGIFLNTASWGLLPRSAAEEVADLTHRRTLCHGFAEEELGRIQSRCRRVLAHLMEVEPDEVALVPNTSFGVNLAAHLVGAGPPGRVVVSAGEFPANVLPWKALRKRGFVVDVVPADGHGNPREAALLEALDAPDVRALAVSWVQFVTGFRMDLPALGAACRARGALFCVDAIQGMGAAPFRPRVMGADVVACGGQKWLCAPWGSGFAWIRRELQERFDPPMVSWLAMEGGTDFQNMLHYRMDWRRDARKFELATNGIQDYLGLARSAEIFAEVGLDRVEGHLRAVLEPLWSWLSAREDVDVLTPRAPDRHLGIVSFRTGQADVLADALTRAGVVFARREGALRLAPHLYTTKRQMERVVDVLDQASA